MTRLAGIEAKSMRMIQGVGRPGRYRLGTLERLGEEALEEFSQFRRCLELRHWVESLES